ncbi:MAG: Gx transporter family protein, partial [Deefgea sp.]
MTVSPIKRTFKVTAEDEWIARLAACAIALAVVEAAIPSPIPGFKPGLANIVTLIALQRIGWTAAVWVSLLRILGAGLVLGGFFSPGFVMSLGGGIVSLL